MTSQPNPRAGARPARPAMRGPFGGRAFFLFRAFGIDVGIDPSWIVIFTLVTVSFAAQFGRLYPDWPKSAAWTASAASSLLFFVSLLLHEFGHSLTSIRLGLPIHSITLFIFGGVARLTREPDRPRDEFLIAAAGPLVSILLSIGFLELWALIALIARGRPEGVPLLVEVIGAMAQRLGLLNFVLVVFNCIPGFPLDGGRILRSIVWAATGSFAKATRWAAAGGKGFACILIGLGLLQALAWGQWLPGLWLVFIGWFLLGAARSSVMQLVFRESLNEVRVDEVFERELTRLPGSMSVARAIGETMLRRGVRTIFVESADGGVGLVTMREVKGVAEIDRETTPLQAIATPLQRLRTVAPDATLWEAMQEMDGAQVSQLPVVQGGALMGILTRERMLDVVRARLELR